MNRQDLKIQFRSVKWVPYSGSRVIEYRVDPEQNISYTKPVKWLFGLFTTTKTFTYNTFWVQPQVKSFFKSFHRLDDMPVWTSETEERYHPLKWFKDNFKTIGEFEDWLDKCNNQANKEAAEDIDAFGPDVIY